MGGLKRRRDNDGTSGQEENRHGDDSPALRTGRFHSRSLTSFYLFSRHDHPHPLSAASQETNVTFVLIRGRG